MKKIYVVIFVILILILTLVFLIFKTQQKSQTLDFLVPKIDVQKIEGRASTLPKTVQLANKDSKNKFNYNIANPKEFVGWLEKINLKPNGKNFEFAIPGELIDAPERWVTPEEIKIELTNVVQRGYQIYGKDREIVYSYDATFQDKTNTLVVTIQNGGMENLDKQTATKITEVNILRALFELMNDYPKFKSVRRDSEFEKLFKDYKITSSNFNSYFLNAEEK